MTTTALRACPICGNKVEGAASKRYCSLRCRNRAETRRRSSRRRTGSEMPEQYLTQAEREVTTVITGDVVTDSDLGAYRRTILSDPCCYCGNQADTFEHIVPLSHAKDNRWTNLASACRSCNAGKKNTTLLSYLLRRSTLATIEELTIRAATETITHRVNYVRKNRNNYVEITRTT